MKKLLSAMSLVLGLGLATAQQTAPATHTTHAPVKTVAAKPAEVKAAKPMVAKTAKPAQPAPAVKMKRTVLRIRDTKKINI